MKSDLTRNAVRGVTFVALTTWIVRVGYIGVYILLARRLPLQEYGLVASVVVLSNLFAAFSTLGYQSALIQRRDEPTDRDLNVAWTIDCFAIRMAAAATMLLIAKPFAAFFGEPRLALAAVWLALDPLISAFENSAIVVLSRRLDFRRRAFLLASHGIGFLAGTTAAVFVEPSLWAVVCGLVVGRVARTTTSYVLYRRAPRLVVDGALLREHWPFARGVTLVGIGEKLRGQSDKLVVGRMLGTIELGVYQFCSRLVVQTLREFTKPIRQVLFPTIARVADDRDPTRRNGAILDVIELHVLLGTFICGVALVGAPTILNLAVGADWVPFAFVIRGMGIVALFAAVNAALYPLLRGLGLPGVEAVMQWLALAVIVIGAVAAAPLYGLRGVLFALLLGEAIQSCVALYVITTRFHLPAARVVRRGALAASFSVVPFLVSAVVIDMVDAGRSWAALSSIGVAVVATLALSFAAGRTGLLPGAKRVLAAVVPTRRSAPA